MRVRVANQRRKGAQISRSPRHNANAQNINSPRGISHDSWQPRVPHDLTAPQQVLYRGRVDCGAGPQRVDGNGGVGELGGHSQHAHGHA